MPSISFEVSTTSPIVKRILVCDSSIATSASLSSIRRCTSPTVLRGTMTPGMPSAPAGSGELDLRQAVAVGRDRAQRLRLAAAGDVQVDAVEIVARLLGRDRELGLVDQALQVGRRRA